MQIPHRPPLNSNSIQETLGALTAPKKKPIIANGIAKIVCENRIKLR
jgi:hypothetical protein